MWRGRVYPQAHGSLRSHSGKYGSFHRDTVRYLLSVLVLYIIILFTLITTYLHYLHALKVNHGEDGKKAFKLRGWQESN